MKLIMIEKITVNRCNKAPGQESKVLVSCTPLKKTFEFVRIRFFIKTLKFYH